jgi:hypothetical protein
MKTLMKFAVDHVYAFLALRARDPEQCRQAVDAYLQRHSSVENEWDDPEPV